MSLNLDPQKDSYQGTVEISLRLNEAKEIWLHGKDIAVQSSSFAGEELLAKKFPEGFYFELPEAVTGTHSLRVQFSAKHGSGTFRKQFGTHWYIFSDFEPERARRAFPCFDDLRFKTPWTIEITHPETMQGFSNYPGKRQKNGTLFETTSPLPSYLVAFTVGTFDILEIPETSVPFRLLLQPGDKEGAQQWLTEGAYWLQKVEEIFEGTVPYPKIDMVSIPGFYGGMENPGLISMARELLVPAENEFAQLRAHRIFVHELIHLWLGDWVTTHSWAHLWLNEGTTTWVTLKLLRERFPVIGQIYSLETKYRSLFQDLAADAKPIEFRDDNFADLFSYRVYHKLGHLLWNLDFQESILVAIRAYAKSSVPTTKTENDLLEKLPADSAALLKHWLTEKGGTLVQVTEECTEGKRQLTYSIKRVTRLGEQGKFQKASRVCIPHREQGVACLPVVKSGRRVTTPVASCKQSYFGNVRGQGYYYYLPENAGDLDFANLSEYERADFLLNLSGLLQTGEIDGGYALSLTEGMPMDSSPQVLWAAADFFSTLADSDLENTRLFRWYIQKRMANAPRRIGIGRRFAGVGEELISMKLLFLVAKIQDPLIGNSRSVVKTFLSKKRILNDALLSVPAVGIDEAFDSWLTKGKSSKGELSVEMARGLALSVTASNVLEFVVFLDTLTTSSRKRVLGYFGLTAPAEAVARYLLTTGGKEKSWKEALFGKAKDWSCARAFELETNTAVTTHPLTQSRYQYCNAFRTRHRTPLTKYLAQWAAKQR